MPRGQTPEEFFAKAVEVDGCLVWSGTKSKDGYGQTSYQGKQILAHRLAYLLTHGSIPEGVEICHDCDNPPCIKPAHLFPGTHAENMSDMKAKKRSGRLPGSKHGRAKITEETVLQIRKEYIPLKFTYRMLSEKHGVSMRAVEHILRGDQWQHI